MFKVRGCESHYQDFWLMVDHLPRRISLLFAENKHKTVKQIMCKTATKWNKKPDTLVTSTGS